MNTNNVLLIGSLSGMPVPVSTPVENCNHKITIRLEENGVADDIDVHIWSGMVNVFTDNYKPGTLVGIKGKLAKSEDRLHIVAKRISFIIPNDGDGEEVSA